MFFQPIANILQLLYCKTEIGRKRCIDKEGKKEKEYIE